jgi:hypothetical protein
MTAQVQRPPATAPSAAPNETISAKRIRFVNETSPGGKVRREFTQPRHCLAVEEVEELSDLPTAKPWPEPTDHFHVVFVSTEAASEWQQNGEAWLAPPDQPEAVPAIVVERDGAIIQWRPGRALVRGQAERREEILATLTDFAFYEGELRGLEQALESREADAQADVARAHRIRYRDRKHWRRFGEMIEYFARMRLTYARLEPRLAKGARTLPRKARRVMSCLLLKADVEGRLEALNDRLEACADLYEGANDRVADYRGYLRGYLLEIGIIVLLLLEVLLISGDLYLHYREYEPAAKPDGMQAGP